MGQRRIPFVGKDSFKYGCSALLCFAVIKMRISVVLKSTVFEL
jgi:hypothetical protein